MHERNKPQTARSVNNDKTLPPGGVCAFEQALFKLDFVGPESIKEPKESGPPQANVNPNTFLVITQSIHGRIA